MATLRVLCRFKSTFIAPFPLHCAAHSMPLSAGRERAKTRDTTLTEHCIRPLSAVCVCTPFTPFINTPKTAHRLFYPQSRCFGCGPANRFGLRIRSMPPQQPGGAVTAYIAACPVYHSNGMGMTNGGVLASLIDCHTGAAIAWRGWEKKMSSVGIGVGCGDCKDGSHGTVNSPFLTSSLEIKYRRPTPYNLDALIVAEVVHMTEVLAVVKCKVISGGQVTVLAEAKWRRPSKAQWSRTKDKLASIQNNVHEYETHLNF